MIAVIMAGGSGTRFWPRSRRSRPKQFLNIAGDRSLLDMTVERTLPLVDADRILIVTGAAFVDTVREELPHIPAENVIGEPVGRNTAPCIAVAAALAENRWGGDEVMAVLPADHHIADRERFGQYLSAAADVCRDEQVLVTLGIKPTRPETGYGYLEIGDVWKRSGNFEARRLERFVEKPDLATAEQYVAADRYLWNSGMFVWRVDAIRAQLAEHIPELGEFMERAGKTSSLAELLEEEFAALPSVSIDYGVMEKAPAVVALSVDFEWNDVGSWEALADLLPADENGNVSSGDHIAVNSRDCIVNVPGKSVATIGLEEMIIVDTGDALLVCPRSHAQEVRSVVKALEETGRNDLL